VLLIGVILGTSIGSACGCAGGSCFPARGAAWRGARGPARCSLFPRAQEHADVRRRALRGTLRELATYPLPRDVLRHDLRRDDCAQPWSRRARHLQLVLLQRQPADQAVRALAVLAESLLPCREVQWERVDMASMRLRRAYTALQVEGRPAARHHPDARLQGALGGGDRSRAQDVTTCQAELHMRGMACITFSTSTSFARVTGLHMQSA